jgi:putative transposase
LLCPDGESFSSGRNDPEGNLLQWMHQLKTAYMVYFNRRHQVVGHLFQGRFKSTVIEAVKYLLEVSRYLHLNPVRGVVLGQGTPMERRLREHRWSSYLGLPPGDWKP